MTNFASTYWKLHKIPILLVLLGVILYYFFGYHLERTQFLWLLISYAGLFLISFKLIQFEKWNFKFLVLTGIIFRLVLLAAVPNLSDDFYRFIWDGNVLLQGISPYEFTPTELINSQDIQIEKSQELYAGMSELSRGVHSNYPPLNQIFFAITSFLGGGTVMGSIIAIRGIHILSDLGIVYFGRKLLKQLNYSPHLIFWYFLNPLIVLELTGNLHFEGVMLFFFLAAIYLCHTTKWARGAVIYGLAISTKLIPLLFLPLFLPFLKWKKSIFYYIISLGVAALTVVPFVSPDLVSNYGDTLALWFTNFEFNAGIYNIVELLSDEKPWELIAQYGKVISVLVVICLLVLTFVKRSLDTRQLLFYMLCVLTFYYLLSATVHPWYIITLVLLCLFTDFRFPLFWSAVVVLSYSAYDNPEYNEHPVFLIIEYTVVFGVILYELFRLRREKAVN